MNKYYSDFNVYPHKIFANVVLVKGKIANWKTGSCRWTKENYFMSTQPDIVYQNEKDVTVRSRSFVVKNREKHNEVFSKQSVKFYKQFKYVRNKKDKLIEADGYCNCCGAKRN